MSQGEWQHRAFLPWNLSGACRALRRAAHTSQGSPKEMPSSHTLPGPLPLPFPWLYPHLPQLSAYIHSFIILCKHILLNLCTPHFLALLNHIILPSLCMPKWHIHLFLTFQTSGLAPVIPTYSLHIPKGPHLSIFHSKVQCRCPPIAKRSYTMWNEINYASKLHTFQYLYTIYLIHVQITLSGLQSYLFFSLLICSFLFLSLFQT